MTRRTLVMLAMGLSSLRAAADEDADRAAGNERLTAAKEGLAEACAADLLVSYDWSSEGWEHPKPGYKGAQFCKEAADGLKSTCSEPTARVQIPSNIKGLRCRYDKGASKRKEAVPGGAIFELKEGYLVITFDWNTSNLGAETRDWALKRMLLPGPNGQETIETKLERAEGEAKLTAAAADLNRRCGATIAVTYASSSEKAKTPKPAGQGPVLCKSVVDGLAAGCDSDGKKAAFAKKVRAVTCRFVDGAAKSANGGAVLRLKPGGIEASFDWSSSNLDAQARTWIKKSL